MTSIPVSDRTEQRHLPDDAPLPIEHQSMPVIGDAIRQRAIVRSLTVALAAGDEEVIAYALDLMGRDTSQVAKAARSASEMECLCDQQELTIRGLREELELANETASTMMQASMRNARRSLSSKEARDVQREAGELLAGIVADTGALKRASESDAETAPCSHCGRPKPISEWCAHCAEQADRAAYGEVNNPDYRPEADPAPEEDAQDAAAIEAPDGAVARVRARLDIDWTTPEQMRDMMAARGLTGYSISKLAKINNGAVYKYLAGGRCSDSIRQVIYDTVMQQPVIEDAPSASTAPVKQHDLLTSPAMAPVIPDDLTNDPNAQQAADEPGGRIDASARSILNHGTNEESAALAAQEQADREMAEAQAARQELLDAKSLIQSALESSEAADRETIVAGLVAIGVRPVLAERAFRSVMADQRIRLEQQESEEIAMGKVRRESGRARTNGLVAAGRNGRSS